MVNSVWLSTRSPKPAVLMSLCDLGRHNARGSFALQAVLLNTELPTINPHDMRIMPWWKHAQMAELPFFLSGGYSVPFTELSKTIRFIITFYCKTSPAFQFVFDIQISPCTFEYVMCWVYGSCISGINIKILVFLCHDAASWDLNYHHGKRGFIGKHGAQW